MKNKLDDFLGYDVSYYGLEIELFPEKEELSGFTDLGFRLTEARSEITVALAPPLHIDSVKQGGQVLTFRSDSGRDWLQHIGLKETQTDRLHHIRIYYSGRPDQSTRAIRFSENSGAPHIWTLSEPYGAMYWFPVKNVPNDKADSARIAVTVPNSLVVASNGLLYATRAEADGRIRYVWKTFYPIAPYLLSLAVANYRVEKDTLALDGQILPLQNYFYRNGALDVWRSQAAIVKPQMRLFNDFFGTYPFIKEKYGHAMFEFRGGMEHQTLSSMGSFSELLVAHELAHQWFGNSLTTATWSDIWINEGFATFAEGLWIEHSRGAEAKALWRGGLVSDITSQNGGRVLVPEDEAAFSNPNHVERIFRFRTTYQKSAMILEMLRLILGEEAFFAAVQELVQDKFSFDAATTAEVERVFQEYSSGDLGDFFQAWFYEEGFPKYRINWQAKPSGTGARLQLRVDQSHSLNQSRFFALPLPVWLSDGQRDTMLFLWNEQPDQFFERDLPWLPTSLRFDKNAQLIHAAEIVVNADVEREAGILPSSTRLLSNFPNPFNPSTIVRFEVAVVELLRLDVFDLNGRHILRLFDGLPRLGLNQMTLDLSGLSSGVYVLRLRGERVESRRKIMLLK